MMADVDQMVREESERFYAKLPELLPEMEGKWVVFRDGEVKSTHDDQDAALRTALKEYGMHGGYVIAEVAEVKPAHLSALAALG
ncbi:MAG: hypothetical protein MJD61_14250 [Proteobacteria bacterium]|nr:hypothetical protein [Pseudomonadota bacterium]